MTTRTRRLLLVLTAFVASIAVVLVTAVVLTQRGRPTIAIASAIGGPFTLVDQNGKPVTEADLQGRPTLMFFGFTHCPEICPTALFEISEILGALGPQAEQVNAFFVSVDPERDTPEKLKDYLSSFNPRLVGLTGTPAQMEAMAKSYRVYWKKVPLEGGDYTMDHTALVYLLDKNGRFVAPFNIKRKPEEAAADLRRYI